MSQRKPKRPSSARHNIKYETFSQFVSSTRLRHVQSLLNEKDNALAKPDAILCITGVDSRYNDGSSELANYLLFGFFDVRKAELESSGFDEEDIDDLMILIRKTSVDVYCNPINYHYLLPYVSHWRSVTFHCMTEDEYKDDEEAAENFKIHSLITMVSGCQKIGIPFSTTARPQTFDKFLIEKWPIVQAFALDDFNSGGFFTLKNEVVDVSSLVCELYSLMDPVSLEVMVTQNLPLLEKQWNNMTSTIDMELLSHPGSLSEKNIFESLKTYFNHGRTGIECSESSKKPFVLFDVQASQSNLDKVCTKGGQNSGNEISAPLAGQSPLSMICQAVAPKCPLTCTRTYFFPPVYDPFQGHSKQDVPNYLDLEYLMSIYRGMVAGVVAGINSYAETLSVTQANLKAVETFEDDCKELKTTVLWKYLGKRSNVHFSIEATDNQGKCKPLSNGLHSLQVKVATMKLYDIPSVMTPGKTTGSLMFAESFLDSVIPVQDKDGSPRLSSEVLLLTSHIPRLRLWNYSKDDVAACKEMQKLLHQPDLSEFGRLLMPGDSVEITTGSAITMPPNKYHLFMYEHGLVLLRPENGAVGLHGSHMKTVSFYDGDSPSQLLLLIIELQESSTIYLPPHLQSALNTLIIMVCPRSKAKRSLLSEVLPRWKQVEDCKVPAVQRLDTLPDDLQSLHGLLQVKYQGDIGSAVEQTLEHITSLQKAKVTLPSLVTFLDHLKVSSVGSTALSSNDLLCSLKQAPPLSPPTSDKLVVTILSGIPGSHKEQLCRTITSLSQDNTRWIVLCAPRYDISAFDAHSLQQSLESAYSTHKSVAHSQKQTRVLVVTPGFTDTVDVVRTITNHPNADIASNIIIGSVTTCVDPLNTYMEHRWPFPTLLNQCAQGWVNCIIFMSSKQMENDVLEQVQSLIRSINTDVALLVAEKGVITRNTDMDLILSDSSFMQPKMVRSRLLLTPGWNHQSFQNSALHSMSSICLKFSKSLEKTKLVNKLYGLKKTLSGFPFKDNVYYVEGRLKFTDSSHLMDLQFVTNTGYLTIHRPDNQDISKASQMKKSQDLNQCCYLVFTGCRVEESKLKDWLRACAKQRPEKKKSVGRKDLKPEDIKQIHKKHHLDALPAGWFYSGSHFVSLGGNKSDTHPNLEEFINDWLKAKNEEISKYNETVDAEKFVDLFP